MPQNVPKLFFYGLQALRFLLISFSISTKYAGWFFFCCDRKIPATKHNFWDRISKILMDGMLSGMYFTELYQIPDVLEDSKRSFLNQNVLQKVSACNFEWYAILHSRKAIIFISLSPLSLLNFHCWFVANIMNLILFV